MITSNFTLASCNSQLRDSKSGQQAYHGYAVIYKSFSKTAFHLTQIKINENGQEQTDARYCFGPHGVREFALKVTVLSSALEN